MTDPFSSIRNAPAVSATERWILAAILLLALGLRLHGIGFGLPALNDPDEPLFMMTAMDMLRGHSLDPHWFGHPGTITLYSLALVMLAVGGLGIATGSFADAHAFVHAVYADPGILFLPARLMIALCGVGCVWLVWSIGRRIGGPRLGLIAAALLAVNALHIGYSQIIRTDMQASLFMLLCTRAAMGMLATNGRRGWIAAGIWAGLACATKWPAVLVLLNPVMVSLAQRRYGRAMAVPLIAIAALLAASPFLLLDWTTVLRDLAGEARPVHPGATGGGPLANLFWYVRGPLAGSLGAGGLLFAIGGLIVALRRDSMVRLAVAPAFLLFFLVVIVQALRWERWLVPLLPFLSIMAGYGVCALADELRARRPRWPLGQAEAAMAVLLMLPMALVAQARAAEQMHDTRQIASAWVRAHVPAGRSILVEQAAFDLLGGPWRFLFPLGAAGCVEPGKFLSGGVSYAHVDGLRAARPVVDLGNVADGTMASCVADYAVLTHYDRYRADPVRFAPELARYDAVIRQGAIVATIRPRPGVSGGPTVRIVARRGR